MKETAFSAFFLEMLNGGAVTPETLWLVLLGVYLVKEARRRREAHAPVNWLGLPPSMNLILAVFICDTGVQLRSLTIWIWRRFDGAAEFSSLQTGLLIAGGLLIVIGTLCKIRALTQPDHGNGPWLRAAGLTIAVLALMLVFR